VIFPLLTIGVDSTVAIVAPSKYRILTLQHHQRHFLREPELPRRAAEEETEDAVVSADEKADLKRD